MERLALRGPRNWYEVNWLLLKAMLIELVVSTCSHSFDRHPIPALAAVLWCSIVALKVLAVEVCGCGRWMPHKWSMIKEISRKMPWLRSLGKNYYAEKWIRPAKYVQRSCASTLVYPILNTESVKLTPVCIKEYVEPMVMNNLGILSLFVYFRFDHTWGLMR